MNLALCLHLLEKLAVADNFPAKKTKTRILSVFFDWRRGRDSNPQVLADGGFQNRWNSRYPTSPWGLTPHVQPGVGHGE